MSIITVPTAFNIDLEFRIAPFHKRLLAWIIDLVIVYGYILLMFRFVVSLFETSNYLGDAFAMVFVIVPAFCYHLLMELFFNGRSVGKMALGLKVLDLGGKEATVSQYLLRWIFRMVDMGVTLGAGALFSAALTQYSQRLGDLLAGTIVIDQRRETHLHETIHLDLDEAHYEVSYQQVMRLTDRDINGIRNLLAMKEGNRDNENYIVQVTCRIKEVLEIETEMEPRELLQVLLNDYNFLTKK